MSPSALLPRRAALFVGVLALGLAGSYAYRIMPRSLEPAVTSNFGVVELLLPGVSSAELEKLLTERIEAELLGLPAVIGCRTQTQDGAALLFAECRETNGVAGASWSSIESCLRRLREELRDSFIGLWGPFLRRPAGRYAEAIVTLSRDAADPGQKPVKRAEELAASLRAAAGVAHVDLVGREREQIVLTYEDADLARAGITPLEFREYLKAQQITAPGAYLTEGTTILPIETVARLFDFDELNVLPVRDPDDGDAVNLNRLLDVKREAAQPAMERVFLAGRPALALAVYRAEGAALDEFTRSVQSIVLRFQQQGPEVCETVVFQPDVVHEEMDRFQGNLIQSFVAILVLLLVILGLRTGLAVATVLPFVLLTSFVVLYWAGLGFHIVTLSSFILVLGLLVDNHVVMAERTQRLEEQGVPHGVAISRATRELIGPLLAASLTTVFGFLPVVLTDDVIGEYVSSLFWVVLVTLSVSLTFCFLVTPCLLRRKGKAPRTRPPWPERVYRTILRAGFPLAVPLVLVVAGLCFGGYRVLTSADQVFFPASSRPLWLLDVEFPHGTDGAQTEAVCRELDGVLGEEALRKGSALLNWVTFVGRSAPPFQASIPYRELAPHTAQVLIGFDPDREADALEKRLRAWISAGDRGCRTRLRSVQLGAQLEWPIQVEIAGPLAALPIATEKVEEKLRAAGCRSVSTDWGEPIRKLRVVPDREALASRDLTVSDLTAAMHSVLFGLPVFDLDEGQTRTAVMLKASARRENRLEALSDAYVYPQKGDPALLYEVASVEETLDHPVRARKDGLPCITVRAETGDPARALATEKEIDAWLDPLRAESPELSFEVAGLSAAADRANRAILDQMPWALLLVLLCLLVQTRSLLETTLILLTIPLSFVGVAFGLLVTGQPFSFMTLVGMTALAGIVVNNAIVLLASIRRGVEMNGGTVREGLIDSAAERLRPILLTTFCALASMAVLYHSGGPMWRPLATAVISGLAFSTALVLFVLPVLFGVALGLEERWQPKETAAKEPR